MVPSTFLIFIGCVYIAGVGLAFDLAKRRGRLLRGLVLLGLGTAFIYFGVSASSTAQYAGAALLALFLYCIAAPLFVFGLGLSLGSIASFFPKGRIGSVTKSALVFAPVLALAFFLHQRTVRFDALRAEALEKHAAFQLTNVKGTLSGIPVTLPASPSIEVYHDCHSLNGRISKRCRTMFWRAVGLRRRGELSEPAVFQEIQVNPWTQAVADWCNRRPDLAGGIWCAETVDYHVRFKPEPDPTPKTHMRKVAAAQDGLAIYCLDYSTGVQCQAEHRVAPSVYARIWMRTPDLDNLNELAPELQSHVENIWSDISR